MSNFGKRLQQERKMLGLSQTKFAEACGIKRTAQTTYESGERLPDVAYLEAAGRLGVDISFLLTGDRVTDDEEVKNGAMGAVLYRLQDELGIDYAKLEQLIVEGENALRAIKNIGMLKDVNFPARADETVKRWVKEAISRNSVEIDSVLLSAILAGLDSVQGNLSPAKKAHAILYRAFKASGNVDQRLIEEAVKLAS